MGATASSFQPPGGLEPENRVIYEIDSGMQGQRSIYWLFLHFFGICPKPIPAPRTIGILGLIWGRIGKSV